MSIVSNIRKSLFGSAPDTSDTFFGTTGTNITKITTPSVPSVLISRYTTTGVDSLMAGTSGSDNVSIGPLVRKPLHTIVEMDSNSGYLLISKTGGMQPFKTIKELADWIVADAVMHRLQSDDSLNITKSEAI